MSVKFRPATPSDIPLLRNFESKLVAHERAAEPTLIQEGPLEYYDIPKLIEDSENVKMLIAQIDGEAVGCGFGQIKENDPCYNEKHYGYIGLMYVDESHRGKNIGGLIIENLVKWLHEKDISEICLKVYASNAGAVKTYEKYGFKHYIYEMKLQ